MILKMQRVFLIIFVGMLGLGLVACSRAEATQVAPTNATLTSTPGQNGTETTSPEGGSVDTGLPGIPYPSGEDGTVYPPPIPYPGPQFPPPASAYPDVQATADSQAYPPPGVELLPGGAYPVPPTPANPWTTAVPGQDATAEPTQVPGSDQTTLPYPAPGTTATPGPYPAPGEQPTPTQIITPTFTPTATATPLPVRVPVSSRIIATDPKTVDLISGEIQFIEFFAFWDGYSKSMAPIVHQLEARYGSEIKFIYLDIDDPATKELKLSLGYIIQPHFFLLDEQGKIIEQWIGLVKESEFESVFQFVLE